MKLSRHTDAMIAQLVHAAAVARDHSPERERPEGTNGPAVEVAGEATMHRDNEREGAS